MQGKITLITPPDIFENSNTSILFINITDAEQDAVSKLLSESFINDDINIYSFNNENNVLWLLYSLNLCKFVYINIDNLSELTQLLAGHILAKSSVSYMTTDENIASVYNHINLNRTTDIKEFVHMIETYTAGKND